MCTLHTRAKGVARKPSLKMWASLFLSLIMAAPAAGQHPRRRKKPPSPAAAAGRKVTIDDQQLVIPDLLLTDQDGRKARFYTDLLKDKTFVLGFFFTSCTYVCPRQGSLFSALQQRLGGRLGRDVFIVSLTMDPQTDTVERLRAWAARYGRRPGWTLVTGPVSEMDKLFAAFTGQKAGPQEIHSGQIFIVNDRTGRWTYVDELTTAAEAEKRINEVGLPGGR